MPLASKADPLHGPSLKATAAAAAHCAPPTRAVHALTLANRVLPVPGGPYTRMFLYRLWFFLVFLVAMAMSRTRASRLGCQGTRQVGAYSAASVRLLSTRTSPKAGSSQAFRKEKLIPGIQEGKAAPAVELYGQKVPPTPKPITALRRLHHLH